VPLTQAFSTLLGRRTRTWRGGIGASTPVFGFWPILRPFCLTANVPKPLILTDSPTFRARRNALQGRFQQIRGVIAGQPDLRIDHLSDVGAGHGRYEISLSGRVSTSRSRYASTASWRSSRSSTPSSPAPTRSTTIRASSRFLSGAEERSVTLLDRLKSTSKSGNFQAVIEVESAGGGVPCLALAYMKARELTRWRNGPAARCGEGGHPST
jgi:hypothetical protein